MTKKNFLLFLIYYCFGFFTYDFLSNLLNFNFIDEIIVMFWVIVFFFYILKNHFKVKITTSIFFAIIFLALNYSLYISVNVPKAIFVDLINLSKPFLIYVIIREQKVVFSLSQKMLIFKISLFFIFVCCVIGLLGSKAIDLYFKHSSRYATCVTISSLTLLYSKPKKSNPLFLFLFSLSFSLLSLRSKSYGLFAFVILFSVLYYPKIKNFGFKITYKLVLSFFIIVFIVLIVVYKKLNYYFVEGIQDGKNIFARPALYITSYRLMLDYFPCGSGFGSFASYASEKYYSPIYHLYKIDKVFGLTQENGNFICDTFFPQLIGQFGIIGFILFMLFFFKVYQKNYKNYIIKKKGFYCLFVTIISIIFIFIESFVDTTLVQNRGVLIMIIMALTTNELEFANKDIKRI